MGASTTSATRSPNDFHTYAIEWQPDEIRWYVDGIQYHHAAAARRCSPEPMGIQPSFLHVAQRGGWRQFWRAGRPETVFPQSMLVDYVRLCPPGERYKSRALRSRLSRWLAPARSAYPGPVQRLQAQHGSTTRRTDDGLTLSERLGLWLQITRQYRHTCFDRPGLDCRLTARMTSQ